MKNDDFEKIPLKELLRMWIGFGQELYGELNPEATDFDIFDFGQRLSDIMQYETGYREDSGILPSKEDTVKEKFGDGQGMVADPDIYPAPEDIKLSNNPYCKDDQDTCECVKKGKTMIDLSDAEGDKILDTIKLLASKYDNVAIESKNGNITVTVK